MNVHWFQRLIDLSMTGWHGQAYSLARGFYRHSAKPTAILRLLGIICIYSCASGCSSPSTANIELRKKNQDLTDQITTLTRTHEADQATIQSLQNHNTIPTLPQDRLNKLFTTHGLELGRLTGGADLDHNKPGDEALKIYATPTDDEGEPLKAAGSFTIQAFDLAATNPEIGKWTFDTEATRKAWLGQLMAHAFVLTCPWQTTPTHEELTIKVTFQDELTQREFHAQTVVKVKLPVTQPAKAL
jgi:hypothetical protein